MAPKYEILREGNLAVIIGGIVDRMVDRKPALMNSHMSLSLAVLRMSTLILA